MSGIFKNVPREQYRPRWRDLEQYEEVPPSVVPRNLTWVPTAGRSKDVTVLHSVGDLYRLVRYRPTGEVAYYKRMLAPEDKEKSPAEKLDTEPKRARRPQLKPRGMYWFVVEGSWFLIEVVARTARTLTIRPVTGWDADKTRSWPYPDEMEAKTAALFRQIRALAERYI